MDSIRAFVAVELPAEIRDLLAGTQAKLREAMGNADRAVRWSRVEGVHLTLQFLGDVPTASIGTILGAMRAGCAGAGPINLTAGDVGAFPDKEKPRVVWIGLTGDTGRLQTLQASIAQRLGVLGYQPDKPFRPHVTLGRVREHVTKGWLAGISQALQQIAGRPGPHPSFTVHHVSLMKSDLQAAGAVYTALSVVDLGE